MSQRCNLLNGVNSWLTCLLLMQILLKFNDIGSPFLVRINLLINFQKSSKHCVVQSQNCRNFAPMRIYSEKPRKLLYLAKSNFMKTVQVCLNVFWILMAKIRIFWFFKFTILRIFTNSVLPFSLEIALKKIVTQSVLTIFGNEYPNLKDWNLTSFFNCINLCGKEFPNCLADM